MKKILSFVMMILVVSSMLACMVFANPDSDAEADATENEAVTEENAAEDTNAEEPSEDVIYDKQVGIEVDMPASYLENQDKVFLNVTALPVMEGFYLMMIDLYPAPFEELAVMDEAAFAEIDEKAINGMFLFRVLDKVLPQEDLVEWCETKLGMSADLLELAATYEDKNGDSWSCYVYTADKNDIPENLDEEYVPIYEAVIEDLNEAKKDVRLGEIVNLAEENTGKSISFVTTDVDGNEVTSEEIFAGAEYTMLNCWASWCGPCKAELPEIEKMSKDFEAKGGQVVGILMDGNTEKGLTDGKAIMEENGVTYLNVINTEEIDAQVSLTAYPTTFFIDSKGTIVGDAVIGADLEGYITIMNGLLGE